MIDIFGCLEPSLHLRRIHTIFSNGTNLLPKDNLVTDYNTIKKKNNHSSLPWTRWLFSTFAKKCNLSMKTMRVCYNQAKRNRIQILLLIIFVLAFTVCIYLGIQSRTTIVYLEDGKYTTKGISNDVFQYIKEVKSYEASSEGTVQASKSSITRRISPNDLGDKVTLLHEQKLENEIKDVPHSLPGFLNHHIWEHVCGYHVESLREFILFPQAPSKRRTLSMSSAQRSDEHNNFGEQIFGLISPNVTGKYQFAISSSGNSELWLSSDETSENLRKIAFVTSDNHLGRSQPGNFSNTPSQISSACFLTKNNRYLISILHKHNVGRAHLDVAWRLFGREVKFNVISSLFLWAVVNDSHVTDNTVQISDYQEQLQRSHVMHPPFADSEQIKDVLTSCHYEPSYLVKHKLILFQVSDMTDSGSVLLLGSGVGPKFSA